MAQSAMDRRLILLSETSTIPFCWQGDSILQIWEPHVAMLIPLTIKNCPRKFYMQFDTGAPYSILYSAKLDAIREKYPEISYPKILDGKLESFSFEAGDIPITAHEITVQQFGASAADWNDTESIEIIGTIGTDLIHDRVAIIDYINGKLTIAEEITNGYIKNESLFDFVYTQGRMLLPAKLNNRQTLLYFDTGSSMFELLADKETCDQLTSPGALPIKYKVESWGNQLTAVTVAAEGSLEIDRTVLPVNTCTYMEGVSSQQIEQMAKLGIGGMIGNKLFVNHILIIDTKHSKFGITSND